MNNKEKFYDLLCSKRKERKLTIEDTMFILECCGYKCKLYETSYNHGESGRWNNRHEFEKKLVDNKLLYFAYVKFYQVPDTKEAYALVGGKTGSKNVLYKNSDVSFSDDVSGGENANKSKKWLEENNYKWYTEKILVLETDEKKDKLKSESEALDIEREITGLLGLYSS